MENQRDWRPATASYCAPGAGAAASVASEDASQAFAAPALPVSPEAALVAGSPGWELAAGIWAPALAAPSWRSLAGREPLLDLSGYEWESSSRRDGGCDWKIFMEIYFDDYHVEPFHPGLSSLADCGNLRWMWEAQAQAQWVGPGAGAGSGNGSHAELARLSRGVVGAGAPSAVWAAIYPATMVEWLAGGVAVSSLRDLGPGRCANQVSFCYPKGVAKDFPEFVRAHQAAYWETAQEDDQIAARIQAGRQALAARGEHDQGPIHPHLEAGIERFHRWLAGMPAGEDAAEPAGPAVSKPKGGPR